MPNKKIPLDAKRRKEIEEVVKSIRPIQNDAFAYFASRKEFCQEFLRVILEDDRLKVIENESQKFLPNVYFKSSQIDMLCKLSDGRIVNVEIQLYDEDAKYRARRIFHYASMIRASCVDKGMDYKDIDDIIIIYLTEEDFYNKGNSKYCVEMQVISDSKEHICDWDCGLQVLFVNTKGLSNKSINNYLKLFIDNKTMNDEYPETTKLKKEITMMGGNSMSTWFQNMLEDVRKEGKVEGKAEGKVEGKADAIKIITEYKNGILSVEKAANKLDMSKDAFVELIS